MIDLGKIEKATLERLRPFGFKLLVYDPYINKNLAKSLKFKLLERHELSSRRVWCAITALAILQKNIEIINSEFFKKMKKNGILVNTARSKLEWFWLFRKASKKKSWVLRAPYVLPVEATTSPPLMRAWKGNANWLAIIKIKLLIHAMHIF